jgi:hypothetical protein
MNRIGEEDDRERVEMGELRRRPGGDEQNDERNDEADEIRADIKATKKVLRQTTAEEEAHYRANDQWDDKKDRPKTVEATYSFWKGSDWTHEEKQALQLAHAAIGLGTIYGAGVALSGIFRIFGAQEGAHAATARSDAEQLATGNVSEINQAFEDSAMDNYRAQITEVTNTGLAAFGAVVLGCYQYWTVCSNHLENVEKLNRPEISKKRDGLQARLDRLKERLRIELEQLNEAADELRLEMAESHSNSEV